MKPHISRTTDRDDYETPQEIVDALMPKPTIDVCATKENAKCERFITPEEDFFRSMDKIKPDDVVWCNPPFSQKEGFVSVLGCNRRVSFRTAYVLLPNNIRETRLWLSYVIQTRRIDRIINLSPRVNFSLNREGQKSTVFGVAFGSCIVVYENQYPGNYKNPREIYWRWK